MAKDKGSLPSRWRERRQEKKARTGATPEKLAEGSKREDPTAAENTKKAGIGSAMLF
jgi:hypothetical protein